MRSLSRVGFTLVELLVVITIIGILIALLLPAVQAAREAARRSQCTNNMRQLALGVQNYTSALGSFPSGYMSNHPQDNTAAALELSHWSWGALVLPYIEMASLHEQLQVGKRTLHANLATSSGLAALQSPLATFACPSDIGPALNNFSEALANPSSDGDSTYRRYVTSTGSDTLYIAKSNYVGVACSSVSSTPPSYSASYGPATGVLYQNSSTRFRDITDGTSNTLLLGERCFRIYNLYVGAADALGFSSTVGNDITRAAMSVLGIPYYGINACSINRAHQARGFHSTHPGGANFALCDGSIRFISQNIEYHYRTVPSSTVKNGAWVDTPFERLCARNDGQPIGIDF